MAAPRKFATLAADALRRSVSPEMERAAEVQLREVVRRVWWVLQPYRSFGESRVTIRRTEDTMKYIRGLPADSTQRATATALRARDAAQTAWPPKKQTRWLPRASSRRSRPTPCAAP